MTKQNSMIIKSFLHLLY